jgi:hypothetical protein
VKLLDLLDRIAPMLRHYPQWARAMFAVTLAAFLGSAGVFLALSPSAKGTLETRGLRHGVRLDVGVASLKSHRTRVISAAELRTGVEAFDQPLGYEAERVGSTLRITPGMEYFDLIARGGPLPPIPAYQWWDAAATYPALDVKLLNSTKDTVFVTSVDVVVDKSVPDPRPVPVVHPGENTLPRSFHIFNEGTPMRDVRVAYDIGPPGSAPRWRARYPYAARVGGVDRFGEVPVARGLQARGVDVAAITALEDAAAKESRALGAPKGDERARLERASVPFDPDKPVLVYGTFTYTFTPASGVPKTHTVRFSSSAFLARMEFGIGSLFQPTAYYNVRLRTSGAGYTKAVEGISQVIRPGRVDRFQIALAAKGSSRHLLRLRIGFNGLEPIESKPFDVRMFVANTLPYKGQPQPVEPTAS